MLLVDGLLVFFFSVELSEQFVVDLPKTIVFGRGKAAVAAVFEERLKLVLGQVRLVFFLHVVWVFALQDLVFVLVVPSTRLRVA